MLAMHPNTRPSTKLRMERALPSFLRTKLWAWLSATLLALPVQAWTMRSQMQIS